MTPPVLPFPSGHRPLASAPRTAARRPATSLPLPGARRATPMARLRKHVLNRLLNLLFSYPTDSWEFAASLFLMGFGTWVAAFPANLGTERFAAFVTSAEVLPLPVNLTVGGLAFLPGLVGFVSLFFRRFDRLRIGAVAAECAAFVTIAYGFGLYDYRLTSTPTYGLMALLTGLSLLRLILTRVEVREALGFVPPPGSPVSRSLAVPPSA